MRIKDLFTIADPGRKKKGAISLPYVILITGTVIVFASVFNQMKNNLAVRNFESVTDLAAVETLRKFVDEKALANEHLQMDADGDGKETSADMDLIRDEFLASIRKSVFENTSYAIRVEIPDVDENGEPVPPADWKNGTFENSQSAATGKKGHFSELHYIGSADKPEERYAFYLDGTNTENSAMSIVCDRTNLATSGLKGKQSYMLTAKVMIIYNAMPLLNKFEKQSVGYTDIFSDNVTVVRTDRLAPDVNAITLQIIGKVTLR